MVVDGADRPPTIAEAADWLKRNSHEPEYCRACLRAWRASMGAEAVKHVFERAGVGAQCESGMEES